MTRTMLCITAALLLPACEQAFAQDRGVWRAESKTASAITGDIVIAEDKLTISFFSITIAQIRQLQPAEINATFNAEAAAPAGNLYRLNIPARKVFLHKNTLCGAEDTQWMATYTVRKTMQVAFFSGSKVPNLTPESLANTTDLCGTFTYSR